MVPSIPFFKYFFKEVDVGYYWFSVPSSHFLSLPIIFISLQRNLRTVSIFSLSVFFLKVSALKDIILSRFIIFLIQFAFSSPFVSFLSVAI